MNRDELRRTCRESIDRPDAEGFPSQAGRGLAYASIILGLLDELETAEARVIRLSKGVASAARMAHEIVEARAEIERLRAALIALRRPQTKTQLERLKELFDEMGMATVIQDIDKIWDYRGDVTHDGRFIKLTVEKGIGFFGFHADFYFTIDGRFHSYGIWE